MSNEDKKISQLPQASTLQGSELLLYGGAANGSVSAATLKAYAREGLATQEQLDTKLDKEVWDEEHEQFGQSGYWHSNNNGMVNNLSFINSGLMPINHNYDIQVSGQGTSAVAAISLFDAEGKIIESRPYQGSAFQTITYRTDEIPAHAVYFIASTSINYKSFYSNGPAQEAREGAVSDAIQASKLALFVDMWRKCYGCQYDATKEKPFTCNGVELTYEEAIVVYNMPRLTYNNVVGFVTLAQNPKTIILSSMGTNGNFVNICNAFRTSTFVSLRLSADNSFMYCTDASYAFYGCVVLRQILGAIRFPNSQPTSVLNMFMNCTALEEVQLHSIGRDISLAYSPLLSLASLQYLVANAANTSAITVTVHPDVYAKLTGDTTNAAASGLTEEELSQWQQVLTDATAKNISFATV